MRSDIIYRRAYFYFFFLGEYSLHQLATVSQSIRYYKRSSQGKLGQYKFGKRVYVSPPEFELWLGNFHVAAEVGLILLV
jgi:hypothetical protein